jgi:serine O-acetyltransferase
VRATSPSEPGLQREVGPFSLGELVEMLREDYAVNGPRSAISPGFHALVAYRFGRWQRVGGLPRPLRALLRPVYLVAAWLVQTLHGIELYPAATIGRRLRIFHRGAVVNGAATIGDDCLLRHYVTVGALEFGGACPTLGARVELGPGAVVIGGVTVGDGALIGPNAVVTFDVPAGGRVVASPARVAGRGSDAPPAANLAVATAADVARLVADVLGLDERPEEDEPLVSSGLVDSFNLVRLIEEVEVRYGVDLPIEEVGADALDSAASIAAFLASRRPPR